MRPELQDWLRFELLTVKDYRTGPFSKQLGNNFELDRNSCYSQDVGKGGLILRGVAFMAVLAALTVLVGLESTLPSFCLSYKILHKERNRGGFDGFLAVSAVMVVSVMTAPPLKLVIFFSLTEPPLNDPTPTRRIQTDPKRTRNGPKQTETDRNRPETDQNQVP